MNINELEKNMKSLKRKYDRLNKLCAPYEKKYSNGKLSDNGIRKLNSLYDQMEKVAEEYKKTKFALAKADFESRIKGVRKSKSSMTTQRLAAAGLAATVGLSAIGLSSCNSKEITNEVASPSVTISEVVDENSRKSTIDEVVSITKDYNDVQALIDSLNENQQFAWNKINKTQKYFNNVAAPTISIPEDNGAQLYLTAEECVALYSVLNFNIYTPEELAGMFGNSNGYYNMASIKANFESAMRILNYYWFNATEYSGISQIFANEEDAKVFVQFESLLLQYNKTKSEEDAKYLHDFVTKVVFFNGDIDNYKAVHPGVLAVIGMGACPELYLSGVISEEELDQIVTIYESVICDKAYTKIEDATEIKGVTENEETIKRIIELLDKKNILVSDRNINFAARTRRRRGTGGSGSYSVTTTEEVSRDEAVNRFGEEAVKDAEDEAKNNVEKDNQGNKDYIDGVDDVINSGLYDDIYDDVLNNGKVTSDINLPTNGNGDHDNGVNDAAQTIIDQATNDAQTERDANQMVPQDDYYVSEDEVSDDMKLLLN